MQDWSEQGAWGRIKAMAAPHGLSKLSASLNIVIISSFDCLVGI